MNVIMIFSLFLSCRTLTPSTPRGATQLTAPGLVSWALDDSEEVGHDLKAYEYGSGVYSRRIATDELRYGDIIVHVWAPFWGKNRCTPQKSWSQPGDEYEVNPLDYLPGHVFFFDRWRTTRQRQNFGRTRAHRKPTKHPTV